MNNSRSGRFGLRRGMALAASLAVLASACGDSSGSEGSEAEAEVSEEASVEASAAVVEDSASEAMEEPSGDRTEVRWFVGLGAGAQEEQIAAQDAVVEAFNASQDGIELVVEYVDNEVAADTLATQIAAGNGPDIIGPVGLEGSNAFAGQYADLEPLIDAAGFDMSPYEASADVYRNAGGELEGIPFAIFPAAIFYNTDLFDEAGLPYPPAAYAADGTSVYGEGTEYEGNWDYEKLAEIATILAVDTNGNDATSADFDPENIVQFGFAHQWTTNPTSMGTSFGAGAIEQADGSAKIPAAWVDSYKWYQDMVHVRHASPDQAQTDSDLLGGNVFGSGNVAMASTHLWYTCCLADADGNPSNAWNLGALPTHNGVLTSKLHGDNFRLHKDSEHLTEAFDVLAYFYGDATLDLLAVYGGMPSNASIRDAYFADLDDTFAQGVNWDVILDGLNYPDLPNHQSNIPSFLESDARIKEFEAPLMTDPDLDIDAAIAQLEADLDAIWAS